MVFMTGMPVRHEVDCSGGPSCKVCLNCGHTGCQHRLDSTLNLGPTHPQAKFRCLGPGLDGCSERCPDMVRSDGE